MTSPLNVTMLLVLLAIAVTVIATACSPDLLEIIGRKMRARARAIRASRKYWTAAYNESLADDATREQERQELALLIGIEMRDGR